MNGRWHGPEVDSNTYPRREAFAEWLGEHGKTLWGFSTNIFDERDTMIKLQIDELENDEQIEDLKTRNC